MNAKVHDFDTATVRDFKYLNEAMRYIAANKITGYVVTPAKEVIDTRKGKRKSVDGKRWVPCAEVPTCTR